MGILFKIGLAVAFLAFMYGAWLGFVNWVAAPMVAEQIKADQKVVDAANANQKSAELERDNAKADTASCVALSKRQGDAVEAWKAAATANAAAAKAAKERASREATAQAPRIADLQAKAAAAPMLMACSDELAKARVVLQDQLRRARGLPTTPAPVAPAVGSTPVLVK